MNNPAYQNEDCCKEIKLPSAQVRQNPTSSCPASNLHTTFDRQPRMTMINTKELPCFAVQLSDGAGCISTMTCCLLAIDKPHCIHPALSAWILEGLSQAGLNTPVSAVHWL